MVRVGLPIRLVRSGSNQPTCKNKSQKHVTVFNCVRVLNKKKVCKAIFKCLILSTTKMPLRQSSNVCFSQQKKSLQGHLQMFAFLNKKKCLRPSSNVCFSQPLMTGAGWDDPACNGLASLMTQCLPPVSSKNVATPVRGFGMVSQLAHECTMHI